jgi:hypothetical protein
MTRSDELQAIAAALARMDARLEQCLLLINRQHPPPPIRAGLIRRADEHTQLNQDQP